MPGSRSGFHFRYFNHKIDVPAFSGVLTKTAAFNRAGEFPALPESEGMTGIMYRIINDLDARRFEWNPSRRPFSAPPEFAFLKLLTARFVLFAHRLNGLGMKS